MKTKTLNLNNKVFRITEALGTFIVYKYEEYITAYKQTEKGYVYIFQTDKENELIQALELLSK